MCFLFLQGLITLLRHMSEVAMHAIKNKITFRFCLLCYIANYCMRRSYKII
uniref:Uncharacterized protein n=1 Tax=Anguilla anguilla TaxID=7936 RepID=A0A0E9SQG9_ANGAN